jgi:hypothetical protein
MDSRLVERTDDGDLGRLYHRALDIHDWYLSHGTGQELVLR